MGAASTDREGPPSHDRILQEHALAAEAVRRRDCKVKAEAKVEMDKIRFLLDLNVGLSLPRFDCPNSLTRVSSEWPP